MSPPTETSDKANTSTEIPTTILKPPSQLRGDGKSFLQSTPLHCYIRIGELDTPLQALRDSCSNVGLMEMMLFRRAYPRTRIHSLMVSVSDVGTNKTSSFAVVPIRFDCTRNNIPARVQADTEVHLVENFSPGLVLGLDFLCDYGVELDISSKTASFSTAQVTKVASLPSSQLFDVKVLSLNRMTVPGRKIQPIAIRTPEIADNIDYTFLPFTTTEKGMALSPQLTYVVIDTRTRSMMHSNRSEHPVMIEKNPQPKEIDQVEMEFSDRFSGSKAIGHVRDYYVPVNAGNHKAVMAGTPDVDMPDTSGTAPNTSGTYKTPDMPGTVPDTFGTALGTPGTYETDIYDAGNNEPDTLRMPDTLGTTSGTPSKRETDMRHARNPEPDTASKMCDISDTAADTPGTHEMDIRHAGDHEPNMVGMPDTYGTVPGGTPGIRETVICRTGNH
jgi:hypothetical protein